MSFPIVSAPLAEGITALSLNCLYVFVKSKQKPKVTESGGSHLFHSSTFYFILCLRVWMLCLHGCLCTTCVPGANGGQKRMLAALELELQTIVNCLWVLDIESNPVGRVASTLNNRPTTPVHLFFCCISLYCKLCPAS